MLLRSAGKVWQSAQAGDPIAAGVLVVGLPRSEIVSADGAVQVDLLADLGQRGPFPVLESAVCFHESKEADLDLTFERGLVVLSNLRKEGQAKVVLRIRDETWTLHLQEPGTRVGLEIFGRHPPGLPKSLDAKNADPTTDVLGLVLKGRIFLDRGKEGFRMQAPPGPARVHWDNIGRQATVQHLDKLPEQVIQHLADRDDPTFKDICACLKNLKGSDLGAGLDRLLKSDQKMDRLAGVTIAGAIDDLPRIAGVLATSKHADARQHAVLALRHWMGRGPGQVEKLYGILTVDKKLTPVQARSYLHLLFGFTVEERGEPATYELLLHYLKHQNGAVRELAHWHLVRLAPAGKDIPYDAAAPEPQRMKAYEQWRALIPEGGLALPPKMDPEKIK
jgi:hypothetical protein